MKDAGEFQKHQDEQLEKKKNEIVQEDNKLKTWREKLNQIRIEKGNLQGNQKSKEDRFKLVNNEIISHLKIIFTHMQDWSSNAYKLQSLLCENNGRAAFILLEKDIKLFKEHREKVLSKYEELDKEIKQSVSWKEKEVNTLETQLEMQNQNLIHYQNKLEQMKKGEKESKNNSDKLEKIENDLEIIDQQLNSYGISTNLNSQDSGESHITPKKIRSANSEIKTLSEKKNKIRQDIEQIESDIQSKQPILETIKNLDHFENRSNEVNSFIEDTKSKITKRLKNQSKLKFKKNKADLSMTINDLLESSKNSLKKLQIEKDMKNKQIINSENNLKVLEKRLDELKSRQNEMYENVKTIVNNDLGLEIDTNAKISDQIDEQLINDKYTEFIEKRSNIKSSIESTMNFLYSHWEENKSWFLCQKKIKKADLKVIKESIDEFLKDNLAQTQNENINEEIDFKIQALGTLKYIVNDVIETLETEINQIGKEIEKLSQPVAQSELEQILKDITEEESKIELFNDMKSQMQYCILRESELACITDKIQKEKAKLKESGNEGYTQSEYKTLWTKLSKLKVSYKQYESDYEKRRQERDDMQEKIANLQFEANSLREARLKIIQTNASLVESIKIMNSMEKDIKIMKEDITKRQNSLSTLKQQIEKQNDTKHKAMKDIQKQKIEVDEKWGKMNESYIESARLLKTIKNDKIDEDEIQELRERVKDALKREKEAVYNIDQLEKSLESIKKSITEISAGDKRVAMLKTGKELLSEIVKIKENLREKCKFEDEIKESNQHKRQLTNTLNELKGHYNQKSGYKLGLKNQERQYMFDLKNKKYQDIVKSIADREIKYSLCKIMAQEISE